MVFSSIWNLWLRFDIKIFQAHLYQMMYYPSEFCKACRICWSWLIVLTTFNRQKSQLSLSKKWPPIIYFYGGYYFSSHQLSTKPKISRLFSASRFDILYFDQKKFSSLKRIRLRNALFKFLRANSADVWCQKAACKTYLRS